MYVMLLMLIFIPDWLRVETACGLYNVQYPAAGMQGCLLCLLTLHLTLKNTENPTKIKIQVLQRISTQGQDGWQPKHNKYQNEALRIPNIVLQGYYPLCRGSSGTGPMAVDREQNIITDVCNGIYSGLRYDPQ